MIPSPDQGVIPGALRTFAQERVAGRLLPDGAAWGLRHLGTAHACRERRRPLGLDGTKQSTANGKRAQAAIVSAVTDKDADENGVSGFLVFTVTPGYLVLRLEEKKDRRNSGAVAVAFDNFRIPAEPLPGSEVRLRE